MIELRTLGVVDLQSADGRPVSPILRQPKRLMLLAFLALAGAGRFRRRDTILAHFWPDLDEQRARRALRQAIRFLRRSLGEGVVVERGREELGLDATRIRCDAVVCGERLAHGDRAGALALYTGDLLPGMFVADAAPEFQQWLDGERATLRRLVAEAAMALSRESSDATGADALTWARRAVELAPDDETMLRQQLIVLQEQGNHLGALRLYDEFAARLATEYGAEPSVETRAVAQGLRARARLPAVPRGDAADPGAGQYAGGAAPPLRAARRWRRPAMLGLAVVVVVAGAVAVGPRLQPGGTEPRHPRTAIAVLPFQDLSPGGPHAYFAGGLHDELLTQLAKVGALDVMGRTSVQPYAGTTKTLRDVADELGVGSVVEGSVQVLGDRLRVNVQLLDAATGRHLWAERYDRTLDDAFAIQSDVARQIVAAVGATLSGTQRTAIAGAPTANAEAYRLYLQGLEYFHRPGHLRRNWEIAQDSYERALTLDTAFALAHAALSAVHGAMAAFRYDPSPARVARQRAEAEIALRIAPELPQAHVAMGLVHALERDPEAALREYRIALEGLPNDPELWVRIGYAHRRLGHWDEVMAAFERVAALDPRNAEALADLGANTLRQLRRYPEAIELYTRSLALAPDVLWYDLSRGWLWVLWRGRLDSLEAAVDRHSREGGLGSLRADRLLWGRKPDSLLALLRRTPDPAFDDQVRYQPTALYAAWAYQLLGDAAAARAAFDSARQVLDSVVAMLPGDRRVHGARGLALAGLGRREEAQREARWLQQSRIYREDVYARTLPAEDRAQILAGIGETDAALAEIERLLTGVSTLTAHMLRLDPRWDPIRDDPRFQALLVKHANPQPVR
ncbi:MAG TPA: tetratricopeptide repeat protein [Gemmatimonadales bacterium]|nr:tetratricopeptide repeat protein [Gemmatimonadales bacterium]